MGVIWQGEGPEGKPYHHQICGQLVDKIFFWQKWAQASTANKQFSLV
jgi:hypothetical protein